MLLYGSKKCLEATTQANVHESFDRLTPSNSTHPYRFWWAAADLKDTELGVSMKPELRNGTTHVYARV